MERGIGWVPLQCQGRIHATLVDGRFLRIRCTDRACPDVQTGKDRGARVFHVFDLNSRKQWTDFEPVTRLKEHHNG